MALVDHQRHHDPCHPPGADEEGRDSLARQTAAGLADASSRDRLAAHAGHPLLNGLAGRTYPDAAGRAVAQAGGGDARDVVAALERHSDAAAIAELGEGAELVGAVDYSPG